jgi:hypothetical protein
MKMKFITYCDSNYRAVGAISVPIMKRYCEMHRMDFVFHEKLTESNSDVYWNKIAIVKEALNDVDWVIWCDADILIRNMEHKWTDYLMNIQDKNLIISSDYRGLCLGFFIIRACDWSTRLLKTLGTLGNIRNEKIGIYDVKNRLEQDTLKVIADFFENIGSKIELLPENIISNPKTKSPIAGNFAHHYWANNNLNNVVAEMKNHFIKMNQL